MSGESLSDLCMTANVVVIQPGSLYLRLGRASDNSPVKVVHAIARRRSEGGKAYQDSLLVPESNLSSHAMEGLEQAKHQGRSVVLYNYNIHKYILFTIQFTKH